MPENQPINLKELYGHLYRIGHDPAAEFEPGGKRDPWFFVILCRYGQIYPFSSELLAVHITGEGIRARVAKISGVIRHNWSEDGEAIFLFNLSLFQQVAEVLRPRRRRKLSVNHKQALLEQGTKHYFKRKDTVLKVPEEPASECG